MYKIEALDVLSCDESAGLFGLGIIVGRRMYVFLLKSDSTYKVIEEHFLHEYSDFSRVKWT